MGLLEDLERQAEQRRQEEELSSAELAARRAYFRDTLRPTLGRLYEYTRELINTVKYLDKENEVTFPLPRFGEITARIQAEDWSVKVSKDDSQITMTVDTSMTIKPGATIELATEKQIKELQAELFDAGLSANQKVIRAPAGSSNRAAFLVRGDIRRKVVISGHVPDENILFAFTNVDRMGEKSRRTPAEQVDDGFLDQYGRMLLGEDHDFLTENLDDDELDRIRARIEHNKRHGPALRERDPDPRAGLLSHLRDLWQKPESD